jgi:creatinine amidohydrolase/Fe(II)-dependent formamide hydrolase-like protein
MKRRIPLAGVAVLAFVAGLSAQPERASVVTGQAAKRPAPARAKAAARASVFMDEMTMTEVRDAIAAGKDAVLLYSASIEESGPHIALGKHIYKVRYLGDRIARELGNALVAPIMPFAPTSDELNKFPGTINLSPETFSNVNEEVADSLVRTGFRTIVLMADHGGNQAPLKALAPKLDEKYRSKGVRVFFSGDAYAKSDAEIDAWLKEHGYPDSNHGGIADTSEAWAADARSVRPDKIAMGDPIDRTKSGAPIGPTGVQGDPRPSSIKLGRLFDDIKVRDGVAEIRRLIGG